MLSPPDGEPGSRSFIEAASSAVRLSRVWQGLSDVDAAKSGAICSLRPVRQATSQNTENDAGSWQAAAVSVAPGSQSLNHGNAHRLIQNNGDGR